MEYEILQNQDDIEVSFNGARFLIVKRKFNWLGKVISKIYKEDELIVESDYQVLFFTKSITIRYQRLEAPIRLFKKNKQFALSYKGQELAMKRRYFKNPIVLIYLNQEPSAEVFAEPLGPSLPPFKYKMVFKEAGESGIYSLLLFLLDLAPVYG
jgi:hypothetical protein